MTTMSKRAAGVLKVQEQQGSGPRLVDMLLGQPDSAWRHGRPKWTSGAPRDRRPNAHGRRGSRVYWKVHVRLPEATDRDRREVLADSWSNCASPPPTPGLTSAFALEGVSVQPCVQGGCNHFATRRSSRPPGQQAACRRCNRPVITGHGVVVDGHRDPGLVHPGLQQSGLLTPTVTAPNGCPGRIVSRPVGTSNL
jgi:hypothetical protein